MIKSYKDLEVFQQSYELAKTIHQITKNFPNQEKYEVGYQLRRSALSIPLNIAEGYGKKESAAEFKRYLRMSLGSCNETMVLLDFAKDIQYIEEKEHQITYEAYELLAKRIATLIAKWN